MSKTAKDSVAPGAPEFPVEPQPDPLHEGTRSESLGEAAVSGSLWSIAQVVVVKIVSLGGTLALMHLLTPEDYGIATLALSVGTMVVVLQPFTLGDVLLSRPADLARASGTALRLCFFTSLFFALATLAAGPWASRHYQIPALVAGCAWASLRPLAEWTMLLPLARLRAQLRFRTISSVDMLCMTGTTLGNVLMAALRFGFVSVLLPPTVFTAARAWFYRRASPAPASPPWLSDEAPRLFRQFALSGLGQYVHGGLVALAPLLIGTFTSQKEVGWYTMAFTLSIQVTTLTGFSLGVVLQPIFAQMSHDVSRQSAAFLRACRVIAILAMPMFLLQIVLSPPVFRLFLPEKWWGALVLTQILSLGQAFYFCVGPSMGLLKAQGRFAAFMTWQTVQLVVVSAGMLAAGRLWHDAPLLPMVLVGGLYHAISSPVGVWLCVRGREGAVRATLDVFLRPLLVSTIAVLPLAWAFTRIVPQGTARDVASLVILPVLSIGILMVLLPRIDPSAAEDCVKLARGAIHRFKKASRISP